MYPCALDSRQNDELPKKYRFDPNDKFYMAPPMCSLIHYRDGAVLAGVLEVVCLGAGVFGFISRTRHYYCVILIVLDLHSERGLTDLWALLLMVVFLIIGCITTGLMVDIFPYLDRPFDFSSLVSIWNDRS